MKNWNGSIRVSGIAAQVLVVIQSKSNWNGTGTLPLEAQSEVLRLYYTGRLEQTEIGGITITGCHEDNNVCVFTFKGTGSISLR